MAERKYWLDLFTWETWQEFLEAGASVSGFRESMRRTVQRISVGDYLLCYLVGVSRWIGVLEVTSSAYHDRSAIWKGDPFPQRVQVKVIAQLTPETAVPIRELDGQLSILDKIRGRDPRMLGNYLRRSPAEWSVKDGQAVVSAIQAAVANPVVRDVDKHKLAWHPNLYTAKHIGPVTIPDVQATVADSSPDKMLPETVIVVPAVAAADMDHSADSTLHTQLQWMLLKLGVDMGLDVWVARNDRNRSYVGNRFGDLPRLKLTLPSQFDEATNRTIELIDVLWLQGNAIVAAFEIESTTSIYSGLLRMSDLISMQPNLHIKLYIVAPDERRDKVMTEVNRPTFSRFSPPLSKLCRFIAASAIQKYIEEHGDIVRFMRPEFVEERLSESCEIETV